MIWARLKDGRCPKDDCAAKLITEGLLDMQYVCEDKCGFRIGEARFDEITKDKYKPYKPKPRPTDEERLNELNNLDL